MDKQGKRIYISGQIEGTEDFMARFSAVEEKLAAEGWLPINPTRLFGVFGDTFSREDYLKFDLELIGMCNTVYLLNGWQDSKGANREYGYAVGTGKTILFEKDS